MDEQALRNILEGGGGLAGRLFRFPLRPLGLAYGAAMRLRRRAYEKGWARSYAPPVPTVSVGNLTAGGTGKTPFVIMLATMLSDRGRKPGILIRGYRRGAGGISDEAALYRRRPGLVVVEGANRVAAAGRATALGADILLLDDGFQHLRIRRHCDILLIDAMAPWGGGRVLPAGLLREPPSALSRAGMTVVTRSDRCPPEQLAALKRRIRALSPQTTLLTASHRAAGTARLDGTPLPDGFIRGRRVYGLCGIARPEAFRATLREAGAEVVDLVAIRDHGEFSGAALCQAVAKARREGAYVVVTEKDAVKMVFAGFAAADDIVVQVVEQRVHEPEDMERAVRNWLGVTDAVLYPNPWGGARN